ncbi:MAG: hypothetical protein LBT69_04620 [Lactobacillales bacterium]|nr:hypothetical protein [Lactobacillales bacterium]
MKTTVESFLSKTQISEALVPNRGFLTTKGVKLPKISLLCRSLTGS